MNRTIGLICGNYAIDCFENLTEDRPPVSLPYGGRFRLLDFPLSNMVNSHINTVGLITPYYYRSIVDHIGAGKEWGLDRKMGGLYYLPGTVSGVRDKETRFLFRDFLHNQTYLRKGDGDQILITTGSMVANIDFQPMISYHEHSGNRLTLLYKKREKGQKGRGYSLSLADDGTVKEILPEEKTDNLFLDTMIIDRSLMVRILEDYANMGSADFIDILQEALPLIPTGSYCFEGYVNFMNGKKNYFKASMDLLNDDIRHELFSRDRQIITKIHDAPPAVYLAGSEVRNSVMTAGSMIEGTVEHSVTFRGVTVEKGAVVKSCVLMEGCVVKAGAVLENVICDKDVTITAGTVIRSSGDSPCIFPKGAVI